MSPPSLCWRTIALGALSVMLVVLGAAPPATAAVDEVPYPAPEIANDGDSIWIGYNMCYIVVMGPPKGCTGPHKLADVPLSTDVCTYYAGTPYLCGPGPSTDVCDYQSAVYPCRGDLCHPTGTTDVCNPPCSVGTLLDTCYGQCQVSNYDPCNEPCWVGNVNVCDPCYNPGGVVRTICNAHPCDYDVGDCLNECNYPGVGNLPGFCGNPPPSTDPCDYQQTVYPCRGDACHPTGTTNVCPSTDPCDYQQTVYPCAGDVCHPTGTTDVCNPPCKVGTAVDTCYGQCQVSNYDPCNEPCWVGNVNVCDPCYNPGGVVRTICNAHPCDYDVGDCLNECNYPVVQNLPGFCGNAFPSTDVCDYQSAVYPCRGDLCHPTGTTDVCAVPFWPYAEGCIGIEYSDGSRTEIYCYDV